MPPERFAVIGDPIEHSLSPVMHTAAFRDLGFEATYEAIHVTPTQLRDAVVRLQNACYRGFNVTIPHKERIGPVLGALDDSAVCIGAVNTVVNDDGHLRGYNTDSQGFARALLEAAPEVRGRHAMVFGAGGAARAVIHALADLDMRVTVIARNLDRAAELSRSFGGDIQLVPDVSPTLVRHVRESDLLVNATPLGMREAPDGSPLPDGLQPESHTVVFDLVYGRPTPFLAQARGAGCRTIDGLEMLIYQGAASFRLWTGMEPNVEAMRLACRMALDGVAAC